MALAEYDDVYWFPDGTLARNIPARVFPEHSNDFATLYADATGTTELPNPLPTGNDGRLHFWVEAGFYWISIDQESIRVPIGTGEEGVTPQEVDEKIAAHSADTTDVHGIPNTADLATDAELAAHAADTTAVHGIADTALLETQAGAQAKADQAQADAEANASTDAQAKVDEAAAELHEDIAAGDQAQADALAAHAADTTNVHGIPDTANIPTNAEFEQVQADLAAHEADTTAVHGIANTADLATDADVSAVSASLADHVADTTGVHGIADTSELLTSADLEQYATDADLAAHAADTTAVHGIANTADLVTDADLAGLATDADVAAVQTNLDTHAADTTAVHGIANTADLVTDADLAGLASQAELDAHVGATTDVHGIADTSALLTDADLSAYATDAELAAHAADTTAVHGIADTAALETQTGAQTKATAARDAAIADAATKYLNRLTGGTVTGDVTVEGANLTVQKTGADGGYRLRTTGGDNDLDVSRDTLVSYWSNRDFSGTQTPLMRWEAAGPHLIGHVQLGTNPYDSVFDFDTAAASATFNGDLTVTGALNANGVTDWINVRTYGATGDDATDDIDALEDAVQACAPGGVVYLPNGRYRTSRTLYVPPGVTVMMPHSNLMAVPGITDPPCSIKPLAAFTGPSVIGFLNQAAGGYSSIPAEHRLVNVMIDGSAYTAAALDGIVAKGNIQNVVMHGVTIRYMSGNGIYTDIGTDGIFPYSWRLYRVMSDNNVGHGFSFAVMTDITLFDCQAIGNHANGFQLRNLANSQATLCRSEWNGNNGWNFTGNWGNGAGAGGMVLTGCSTDRNGNDGIHVDATGTVPLVFTGLVLRRDGRNNNTGGGGYSAITTYGATTPIIISGLNIYPGTDDNGTGTSSPESGIKILNNTTAFALNDAYIQVATTPIFDDGTNPRVEFGPNIITATGPTTAPVIAPIQAWDSNGNQRSAMNASTDTVRDVRVRGDAQTRFTQDAAGLMKWGSGAAGPDVLLGRGGAGILALTGALEGVVGAAGTLGFGVRVAGDANDRFTLNGDGTMGWGPGSGGTDVHLHRAAVNLLQLDDNLAVLGASTFTGLATFGAATVNGTATLNGTANLGGALNVQGTATLSGLLQLMRTTGTATAYASQVTGEAQSRYIQDTSGLMKWGSGAAGPDVLMGRTAAGVLTLTGSLEGVVGAAGTLGYGTRVTGDANDRFTLNGDGTMGWGPGSGGTDVHLRRAAVNLLQLDDNLAVLGTSTFTGLATLGAATINGTATLNGTANLGGALNVQGTATLSGLLQLMRTTGTAVGMATQVTGDTFDRYRVTANGSMEWGSGTAARDAFLEREAAGILTGQGTFFRVYRSTVGGNCFSARVTGDTASRWFVNADGSTNWGPGGAGAADTVLYRSAAGQLTTAGILQTTRAAATDPVRDLRISGEAQPRFYQLLNGQMYWGPGGSTALDTTLYRDQPGSLVTDTNLTVNGSLFVGGVGQKMFARRTSNLTRTNTATQTSDTQLTFTLAANCVYEVRGLIVWGGSAAGDIIMDFTIPTGATGYWTTVQPSTSAAADPTSVRITANVVDQARTYGWFDNGSPNAAIISAIVVTGASGGTYAFQWAQSTADATGTTVYSGSFLSVERVA